MQARSEEALSEETARLEAHFDWVLGLLRSQRVPEDAGHAARRSASLRDLEAYARRRRFPRNPLPHRMAPTFVDDGGIPCAVAGLMLARGWDDVVLGIRDAQNLAYVDDLGDDVDRFAETSGLTRAELALIQPYYCRSSGNTCRPNIYEPSNCQTPDCCNETELPDGARCEHAEGACVVAECRAVSCEVVEKIECDDGDASTLDSCERDTGCVSVPYPVQEAADEGCSASPTAERGSPAALLAALFLLAVQGRALLARR